MLDKCTMQVHKLNHKCLAIALQAWGPIVKDVLDESSCKGWAKFRIEELNWTDHTPQDDRIGIYWIEILKVNTLNAFCKCSSQPWSNKVE